MSNRHQPATRKTSDNFFRLNPLVAGVRGVIASGLLVGSVAPVHADLPVPGVDALHSPTGVAMPWLQPGSSADNTTVGNTMVINQHSQNAVLNWQSYNVGANNTVQYIQPDGTSIALNRIFQQDASQILGHITANGQIYLVNNNGFVFGNGSVINANTLVASALNISDEALKNGIVHQFDNTNGKAALDGQTAANPNAFIRVETGSSIHVNANGQIILAAPTVSNDGSISADQNGQIILVASQDKVYLQPASSDSPFAGLLVEVGTGGRVANNTGGNISVREGNATLAGFAVNQSGRINATTSVNVNGSVRLLAREGGINNPIQGNHLLPGQTVRGSDLNDGLGTHSQVTFGQNSSVEILPDANGGTAIDEQTQSQSYVEVSANKIQMQSGSSIVVPDGNVNLNAVDSPNPVDVTNLINGVPVTGGTGRVDLEKGSLIDVSGVKNVQVSMARNVADVSVQSYNLRDAPYQRGGVLQGQTVRVDVRNLPSIIDASSATAGIKRSIDERMTTGGVINIASSGDVIVNSGAQTNISGGSVNYQDGYIDTTKLVDVTGRIVDISKADPNQQYVGIFGTVTEHSVKWNQTTTYNIFGSVGNLGQYQPGYTEGKAAGSLNITSPFLAWDGQLVAGAASGIYQRSNPVSGGSFTFNQANKLVVDGFLSSQNVLFQTQSLPVNIGLDDPKYSKDLVLSTALLNQSGISNLTIAVGGDKSGVGGNITVADHAAIAMPALSTLNLYGKNIDINSSIHTAGGTINLNGVSNKSVADSGKINIAAWSVLDVSGLWVNDFQKGAAAVLTDPAVINAGAVSVNANGDLNFNKGAAIKADGGAWLDVVGTKLTAGKAGSISLTSGTSDVAAIPNFSGDLSAFGLYQGGSLTLSANKINVGSNVAEKNALNLQVHNGSFDIASSLGFSTVNLKSNMGNITVKADTNLSLITQNRLLNGNYRQQGSSDSIAGFSQVATLTEDLRKPVTFGLNGSTGVTLETGSVIRADKESTVNISASNAGNGVYIDGSVEALAGNINISFNADQALDYNPAQSIWLGSHANLSTAGTTRLNPIDALGRTSGNVLDGGNVTLAAQRGYVVLEQGSQINVSGSSGKLDLPVANAAGFGIQYVKRDVGSNAGKIDIAAAEGIVLDGAFSAQAGSSTNSGGSLNLTLDRNHRNEAYGSVFSDNPSKPNALTINVVQNFQKSLPANMLFGTAIPDGMLGQTTVSADQVAQAGFTDLHLNLPHQNPDSLGNPHSTGEVMFRGDVALHTASGIYIDAPIVAWSGLNAAQTGSVHLDTAYLQIGSSTDNGAPIKYESNLPKPVTSVIGGGKLATNATWMQLTGASLMTGFNQVDLNSTHDLRAVGVRVPGQRAFTGNFSTAANLNLNASQIYPTTLTNYAFTVTSPGGQINIAGTNTDATPLSAAGQLSFSADVINQNGVLKAPLGSITLDAASSLSFGKDSITTVSANGQTIPFGLIQDNKWIYPLAADGNLVFNQAPENISIGEKHLVFKSPNIVFNKGSVVDVSGGGNLQAAEFQPGLGGSYDYLDPTSKSYQGGFAILPAMGSSLAAYDPYLSANFAHDARSTVYLSGTDTLAAGYYTILPARYALLPGAYLVTPQANTQDQITTTFTKSGLPIVSGYQALAGTNIRDSRLNGYLIETSAQVQKRSEYNIQTANSFFAKSAADNHTSVPILPVDSGQISIDASTKLVLDGLFKVAPPSGGRGAEMDISATNIKVVNNLGTSTAPGTLEILDEQLTNLHIDSLLLGGTRQFDNATGNTVLTVSAQDVTFDQGSHLQMLDLIAAAKDTVKVAGGATISSSGTVNTGISRVSLSGDSAFLRVSADNQVVVDRSSNSGSTGILQIDKGAVLAASKSMLLDGSNSTVLNGDIAMQGGSLSMTANTINIGEISGANTNALNLSNQILSTLTVDNLVLNSRSSINLFGNIGQLDGSGNLAPIHFNNLVLDAAALSGFDNAGKAAKLQANSLVLENSQGVKASQAGNGTGTLDLIATQFTEGSGTVGLNGFNSVGMNVANQFAATGDSSLNVAADLTLTAGSITTTGGHKLAIDAGSAHNVSIMGNADTTQYTSNEFGGAITVSANSITLDSAKILLPSGALKLDAQTGDIWVKGKSNIDLAGRTVNFADKVEYTPGGTFSANTAQGKIQLASDTLLDISTGGGGASGGNLNLKASSQTVELDGILKATGASASIDVSGYAAQGFDDLMQKLATAGVTDKLYFRTRTADIIQKAGNTVTANTLNLVADKGAIDISGTLNADGANNGGSVNLYAGGKITLENHALVTAKGVNNGGKVLLSSIDSLVAGQSGIEIKSGSTINVSGSSANTNGLVTLSALRTGGTSSTPDTGINIQPIAGDVIGASQFYALGVKKYTNADLVANDGTLSYQDTVNINNDTANYMTAAAQNVATTLGSGSGIRLRPGVEIDYKGDLALASAWDFSAQRFGQNLDIPGTLTINASGKLDVNNSITDGFQNGLLQGGDSWSFQLVAGGDQTSADKFATTGANDLTIGTNASIHTGSGDIKLASGGNIVFTDQTSTVYNAGRADLTNRYGALANKPHIGEYPIAGGDLTMRAGGDIKGAVSSQFLNQWLTRQGKDSTRANQVKLTSWAVNASQFQQNIGSFGGGNVDIAASGNIADLSVMMPTTGKQLGTSFANNILNIQGGGHMQVNAGGDISGGAYFLGKGEGSISAGGAIKGSDKTGNPQAFTDGPQLVMSGDQTASAGGDAKLTLNANQGIKIAAVSDAMLLTNKSSSNSDNTKFFSYTANSLVALNSLSGDVHLGANTGIASGLLNITNPYEKLLTQVYPASLNATAFNGSVKLDSDIVLFPSAVSDMNIFAKQDIGSSSGQYSIVMSDANPALLPNMTMTPLITGDARITAAANLFDASLLNQATPDVVGLMHAAVPVHGADNEPARLVTESGDISSILINLPKKAIIQAGRDLSNTPIQIQQISQYDASIISAGRDLSFVTKLDKNGVADTSNTLNKIEIAGPGDVLVKTGRNLDLGASVGLSTVGNLHNTNLSSKGAALDILVGLNEGKPDYLAFIDKYLQDNPLYADSFTQFKTLMAGLMGVQSISDADALAAFHGLTPDKALSIQPQLNAIVTPVFFNELKLAGSASAANKTAGNQGGFDAIATLFPGNQWQGDLKVFYSNIQTLAGGDINLMVPGGKVDAGLSVAPSGQTAKSADELGIVVQGEGKINAFVKDDFIVNTSRVFTLGGGDLLIWSSDGNIDAGKGAKSALAVKVIPAHYDATNKFIAAHPVITNGSGIRTASSTNAAPGDVYLFAPKGVVDAGEAGIAGSNVTISATAVLGANNIQVSGVGTGVPVASTGSVAAGLTGTSNMTAGVSQMAESSVSANTNNDKGGMKNAVLGMLNVEVLGFGE